MNISGPENHQSWFMRLLANQYKSVALVFLASALISSVFLLVLPSSLQVNESSDYTSFYKPVALNLLNGEGLVDSRGRVPLRYPPGYPFILAGLLGSSEKLSLPEKTVLTLFSIFCLAGAAVLIFLISRKIWGPTPGVIAAAGFSTYPFALWLTKQPNVELPFLLFFYGSLWFLALALVNKQHQLIFSFISGALLGASMLIRPIALGLPLVSGCLILAFGHKAGKSQTWAMAGCLLLGVLILVGPWEVWAYWQSGKVILLSTGGVPSLVDGLTFGVHDPGYRQGLIVSEDLQTAMRYFEGQRQQLGSIGSIFMAIMEAIKEHPFAVAKLFIWKALRSWYGTDSQRFESMVILAQAPYLIAFIVAAIKCLSNNSSIRWVALAILLIVAYFWLMSTLVLPLLRYMVPAIGLLFVLLPAVYKKNHLLTF